MAKESYEANLEHNRATSDRQTSNFRSQKRHV